MIDPRKPFGKKVFALECESHLLAVNHSVANTAKPNEPTELVRFLLQRPRDHHNGDDLIPKMTAFEAKEVQDLARRQ